MASQTNHIGPKRAQYIMSEERLRVTGDGHLTLNGADLVTLCETYGTPLFVFDERRLRENYRRFSEAFAKHYPKVAVCYSVKTNSNLAICMIMREEGAFAEVVSSLDLHIALKAGFPAQRIVLDGLYKPEELLREALRLNLLLINTESLSELKLLNQLAGEEGCRPRVGLRLGGYYTEDKYREELFCNPSSRFGFLFEEGLRIFEKAKEFENLNMCGVMIHPFWGIHKLLPLLRQMQEKLDVKMEFVDLGGGFDKSSSRMETTDLVKDAVRRRLGMRSGLDRKPREAREIEEESRLVSSEVKSILGHTESTIVLEPGRYLVHDTGFLALRTGVVKKVAGQNWITTDGGSWNLVPDFHERREIRIANRANAQPEEMVNISGPLPNAWDLVTIKKFLPQIRLGDYIVLSNVGAYALSLSRQFCYPRPAVVLVRPNGKAILIRQKETSEDVTRMDRLEGLGQLQS